MTINSTETRLAEIMKENKVTIVELACVTGLSAATIDRYVHGKLRNIDARVYPTVKTICEGLNKTIPSAQYTLDDVFLSDMLDRADYPENLVSKILGTDDAVKLTGNLVSHEDLEVAVSYVMKFLSEREREVLKLRYEMGLTLEETAKHYSLTRERIRQVEEAAMKKLKDPRRSEIIKNGFSASFVNGNDQKVVGKVIEAYERGYEDGFKSANKVVNAKEEIAAEKPEVSPSVMDKDISDLSLSARSYNCLRRNELNTVGDIAKKTYEELFALRNLGQKSVDEIVMIMKELGVPIRSRLF